MFCFRLHALLNICAVECIYMYGNLQSDQIDVSIIHTEMWDVRSMARTDNTTGLITLL